MAEKIVSPGVFTNEIDQSFLPAAIGEIGAAVVGPTVKGPAFTPTVVSSFSEFEQRFGSAFKSGSDYYTYLTSETAREYLKHGSRLTVLRVLPGSYSGASTTATVHALSGSILTSVDPAVVGGGVKATGSLQLKTGDHGNGTPQSASIGGVTFIITGSGATYTNSSTNIYVASSSTGTLITLSNEFRNVINNSSSLHSLSITASADGVDTVGITSSKSGPHHSNDAIQVWNGAQISGSLTIVTSSVGTNEWVDTKQIQGGADNTTNLDISFRLHTLSDGTLLNNSGSIGTNDLLVGGKRDNVKWEITTSNTKKGTFTLLVRRGDDTKKRKQILETWNELSLDDNSSNYISKRVGDQYLTVGGSGTSEPYLTVNGSYPNKSKYVRVSAIKNTIDYLDDNGNVRTPAASASLPSIGSGSWAGAFNSGDDGNLQHPQQFYDSITSTNVQGLNPGNADNGKTAYEDALNILKNQDEYDFNLLLIPGIFDKLHTSIVTKAIDVCEDRGDCFVIADPVEYSMNITDVTTRAETRDSNYAAMYWPWVKLPQNEIGRDVWVPPSVSISGVYAFSDKVSHEWFAPAGVNRGTIDRAIEVERKLTQSNRDTLYDSNVNPIATFPTSGVTVYGQKTLQKKESALDRVNVRRLLIRLKKFIASSSRFLVFEQNNAKTRQRFLSIVNPFMEQIQSNSGLTAFKVVMDESNNTPDIVDRNILYGQIFVQPTRTAEFIVLDFTVQPTGATFPE